MEELNVNPGTEDGSTLFGTDRRDFVKRVVTAAAALGLSSAVAEQMAEAAVTKKLKPSVIWLHFQECTGCTESLLRTSAPGLGELILDLISLDYHETLLAAAGHQAEEVLKSAIKTNAGKYVLVVEGAVPTKADGIYCKIGGRTAIEILKETAKDAAAVICIGSCASWGGVPSAEPNPTGATGAGQVLADAGIKKAVVTLPGCPANPYNLLGTVLQFAVLGSLPKLDELGRPEFAYGRTIHEHCPRRAHFDAGRFVQAFGDKNHREGHCLYKMGCKGPATHANCSVLHFGEVQDAWPIGIGAPCFGCTEKKLAFRVPIFDTVDIERPMPPDTYPPIKAKQGSIGAVATGAAGLAVGALVGAGWAAAKKLGSEESGKKEG